MYEKDYRNTPLAELNQRVDMIDMALHLGYVEDARKSWRGGKCYVLGDRSDRIIIQQARNNPGQKHFYSVYNDAGGTGTASLVAYALNQNFIPDPLAGSSDPRSCDIRRKVAKVMCIFLAIPDIEHHHVVLESSNSNHFNDSLIREMTADAVNKQLFSKRGLSRESYDSPLFRNTYYNGVGNGRTDNLIFPCYRSDNSIGGLNVRYFNKQEERFASHFVKGTERASSLWHSNIPEKISRIFIAESEFDCMAHFQLRPNMQTLYVSHQGYLAPGQVDHLISIVKENRDRLTDDFKLLLGADNDTQGTRYDLLIVQAIANLKKKDLTLSVNAKDNILLSEDKDSKSIYSTITISSEKYALFKNLTQQYLDKNLNDIQVRFDDSINSVYIRRPSNNQFANIAVTELILNSDLLISNVKREKAIMKDWNDDLKLLNRINEKSREPIDYELFRSLSSDIDFNNNTDQLVELIEKKIGKNAKGLGMI